LPSSLTRVLSRALEYSSRPPESVCSTVTTVDPHAAFLGSRGLPRIRLAPTSSPLGLTVVVCLYRVLTTTLRACSQKTMLCEGLPFSVPACFNSIHGGAGLLTSFPSSTPLGLDLGTDLPLGGLSFPRKPWAYGDRVSHPVYRYSCLHKLFSGP
jgi:hypothetical protein